MNGRRVVAVVVVVAALLGGAWWLWGGVAEPTTASPTSSSGGLANEGALPEFRASRWSAPIEPKGTRALKGLVLQDGAPVAGAIVTATAAHGDEVLSDLPCKCDNQCGQKLLACGCAEASGQLVELVASRTGEGVPLARATTDAEGKFELSGLEDTTVTLWADTRAAIGWLAEARPGQGDVRVEVSAGRELAGQVKKFDGSPASGVVVTAIFSEQSRFFDVTTDARGAFRIGPLPQGKYAVVAMAAGLLPDHVQVAKDEHDAVDLELTIPRSLSGVVLKEGQPVAGAVVKLSGEHRKRTVTTTEQGAFTFERLRPGAYDLQAESSAGWGSKSVEVSKHEDRAGVVIPLAPADPLEGRVVDPLGGPVANAEVSVLVGGGDWKRTKTDASGAFAFVAVPQGKRRVFVKARGFLEYSEEREGSALTVTLTPASLVSGRVQTGSGALVTTFFITASPQDAGAPETARFDDEYASRRARPVDSFSSTDGGFSLDLTPGPFTLTVTSDRHVTLVTSATAPSQDLVLVVTEGGRLSATLVDLDGKPVSGATVRAQGKRERTDAHGRALLAGLPAGSLEVVASPAGQPGTQWTVREQVTIREGETTEVTLAMKAGAPLAGVVLDATGAPLPDAEVMGWSSPADGGYSPEAMEGAKTGADGTFRLRTLPAGEVHLAVRHKLNRLSQTARAPDEKLILRLKAGTSVSGRVVDPNGKPVRLFKVSHTPFDSEDGRFTLPAQPGKTNLAFDSDGYAQLLIEHTTKEGENELGDVRLTKGRVVTGLVLDAATRQPIVGALVDVGMEKPAGTAFLSEELGAATTDAQGAYSLAVAPSSSWLIAAHPAYVMDAVPLGPTVAKQDVLLQRGATLEAQVVDAQGLPVTRARVVATRNGEVKFGEPKGTTFVLQGLTPGRWVVRAQTPGQVVYRPLTVEVTPGGQGVTLAPATDGATVRLELAGARSGLLTQNQTPLDSYRSLMLIDDGLPLDRGVATHVPAGRWRVIGVRMEEAFQVTEHSVDVPASGEVNLKFTPQWKVLPMQ